MIDRRLRENLLLLVISLLLLPWQTKVFARASRESTVAAVAAPEIGRAADTPPTDCSTDRADQARLKLAFSNFSRPYQEGLAEAGAATKQGGPDAVRVLAENGNVAAMSFLAVGYTLGTVAWGTFTVDDALARKWANAAAERGAPDGWLTLGSALKAKGRLREAEEYYERAANAGSIEAKFQLAALLSNSLPAKQDYFNSLLKEGMTAKDYRSVLALSDNNHVFGGDFEEAVVALKRGAFACEAEAMRGLGQIYLQHGDTAKGLLWLERAFAMGDVLATYRLAAAYSGKYGVTRNSEKYAWWINKSKPNLRAAPPLFILDALEKSPAPVVLQDGTTIEVMQWLNNDWFVHTVTPSGFIDLQDTQKQFRIMDTTRRASNIHLTLYPCGKLQGKTDFALLNKLVAAGRYMEAVVELRKNCQDQQAKDWLVGKAREGYAPFQVEQADWLRRDSDPQAVYLFILGVVRMIEDAQSCEDTSAQEDAIGVFSKYEEITQLWRSLKPDAQHDLFVQAVSESESLGLVGQPDYICYHGWAMKIRDASRAEDVGMPKLRPASTWSDLRAKVRNDLVNISQK